MQSILMLCALFSHSDFFAIGFTQQSLRTLIIFYAFPAGMNIMEIAVWSDYYSLLIDFLNDKWN